MSVPSSPNPSTAGAPPLATANHVAIAPGSTAKIRGPITVAILSIVTLGIYVLFWWYFVNREMADYGRARGTKELGDSPTKSLLALFPGGLFLVFSPSLFGYMQSGLNSTWSAIKPGG